jgi:hypothetical protein
MLIIMMSLIMILLVQSTILLNKIINTENKPTKHIDQQTVGYQQVSNEKESIKKFEPLKVPDLDPFSIAPNLKKPPKSAGGFGNKTDQNDP